MALAVWLCLSLRVCTLGEDAFEHAPVVIKKIHAYLNICLARGS